jgi:hypothetical protein
MTGRMACNGETVAGYNQLQTMCNLHLGGSVSEIWPQGCRPTLGVVVTFLVRILQLQIYLIYKNEHKLFKISLSAEVESHSYGQEKSRAS